MNSDEAGMFRLRYNCCTLALWPMACSRTFFVSDKQRPPSLLTGRTLVVCPVAGREGRRARRVVERRREKQE